MKFKHSININRFAFLALLVVFFASCKKFVQVPPPKNQLVAAGVFNNDATANAAMLGIYSQMTSNWFSSGNDYSITFLSGMSADELTNYNPDFAKLAFATNNLTATTNYITTLWKTPYTSIYAANAILEGLANSTGTTDGVKKQLMGEAKFIRAFSYFYLVNLFGDVPLDTTTNYQVNTVASRTPQALVYQQIIKDLLDARNLLSADYAYFGGERARANKWAATALLARVYLYTGDWANAEVQATAVIDNSQYSLLADLNNVFLANSNEAIWQLKPTSTIVTTFEGQLFILLERPTNVSISSYVMNAFEPGDKRRTNWVNQLSIDTSTYYYAYKYKIKSGATLTEYSMVLRLAEQYLIRAEARAQKGTDLASAADDINAIRNRAGLMNTGAATQADLLTAVYHERQVELFTEWGHRWFDLKRTGQANTVLGPIKPGWANMDALYPISQAEMINNPNARQNPGY